MSDSLMGIALQSLLKLSGQTSAISSSKQAQTPSYRDKYRNAGDQQTICQMFHLSLPLPGCSSCLPGNFDQLLGLARRISVQIYLCCSAARDSFLTPDTSRAIKSCEFFIVVSTTLEKFFRTRELFESTTTI